jgi:hypothetical protein
MADTEPLGTLARGGAGVSDQSVAAPAGAASAAHASTVMTATRAGPVTVWPARARAVRPGLPLPCRRARWSI